MKKLKGQMPALCGFSPMFGLRCDRRVGRSVKIFCVRRTGYLRPAVLNQSPIRDPDAVLVGFGHIEAFGSRLPILLEERRPDLSGSLASHQDSRDFFDDAPSSPGATRRS